MADPSMPTDSREIRVFLSSTFRDMDAERSHLVKTVFPRIRATCHERLVGFTEIDLRWGVTEEESRNGATVEICLKEIERCRDFPPFFIGFLGERYGWVPHEDELATFWARHPDSPFTIAIKDAVRRGISVTELEMELAVLGSPDVQAALRPEDAADRVLFLLRDQALSDTLAIATHTLDANAGRFHDRGGGKLETLKERIRASRMSLVDGYTSIEAFGAAIENHLRTALDRYFPAGEVPTSEQRVEAAHATFRFHRLQNFLPRQDIRSDLMQAILARDVTPSLGPVVLGGPSGQGKSALMADLARHLSSQPGHGDLHLEVLDHYVGADGRLSLAEWVTRLLVRLYPDIADLTGPIPEDPKAQADALGTWLAYSARRREAALADQGHPQSRVRFALLIDAIDQLADGGADLHLLDKVGSDGIVVVSVADGTPAQRATAHRERIEVSALDESLRTRMIGETLARYRKALPEEDTVRLAMAPQTGSPLFLGLALEELRLDAQHETLSEAVTTILEAPDAASLLLHAFLLDPDYARAGQPELAVRFMALLGAARQGLSEEQLSALLALPDDPVAEDTGAPRLPRAVLSHLFTSFGGFLLSKGDRRAPMHRIFGEAALAHAGEVSVREFLLDWCTRGGEMRDDVAAEALFQLTALARVAGDRQDEFQTRLREQLHHGVHLHGTERQLVTEALGALSPKQADHLTAGWVAGCRALNEDAVSTHGQQWLELGQFLHRVMFQQFRAGRELLEALHEVSQGWPNVVEWRERVALSLGTSYTQFARHAEAETLRRRVFEARQARLGAEHANTLAAASVLANSLRASGNFADARAIREQVFEVRRRELGVEHPTTLSAMRTLAAIRIHQGHFEAGRELLEAVVDACRRHMGEFHQETLGATHDLAANLHLRGDYTGAQELHERVVRGRSRVLGDEHPNTLRSMNNLAVTLRALSDFRRARALEETVLEARRRLLGENHPLTLLTMGSLGSTLLAEGDPAAARLLHAAVFDARTRMLGAEHPDTLKSRHNLSQTLHALGDIIGARQHGETVVDARRRVLGPEHPDTRAAEQWLARIMNPSE
jgi:hypothetical protein